MRGQGRCKNAKELHQLILGLPDNGLSGCNICLSKAMSLLSNEKRPVTDLYKRYGAGWAVVTNSSFGLGKEYAYQLAQQGFNIVLLSEDETRVKAVAAQLERECKVKAKTIVVSLIDTEESANQLEEKLKKELPDDVTLLVNTVVCALNT